MGNAEVEVVRGLLSSPQLKKACQSFKARCAVITDSNVKELYGDALAEQLKAWEIASELFYFPAGEISKTRETKQSLEDQMLASGFGKDTFVLALGGGVVSDMGGFIASTYCRGVPLILIPTTLLGMVDASVGGKNGVNTPFGKNMVGSYLKPHFIFIDFDFLKTLPTTEMCYGFVEMIKHSLIAGGEDFAAWEKALRPDASEIIHSLHIKSNIIQEDPYEEGKRRLLNFGHTVGHAIETNSAYAIPHGEAVAIGMIVESHISVVLKHLSVESFKRIVKVLLNFTRPLEASSLDLMKLMTSDKKSLKNVPRFVLLQDIGRPMEFDGEYCTRVDEGILNASLTWTLDVLRSYHRTHSPADSIAN